MDSRSSRTEHTLTWGIVLLAVGALVFLGYRTIFTDMQNKITMSVGAQTFYVAVAETDEERQIGLSQTPALGKTDGLLMVFDSDGLWKIWMKDMRYPIDIIWLDADKRVVHTVRNAPPDESPHKVYRPQKKARYVVELPSGSVARYGITSGQQLQFNVSEGIIR